MLDPNLEKIKQHHMSEIQKGKIGNAVREAEDYLEYILCFQEKQIRKELGSFARALRHVKKDAQ